MATHVCLVHGEFLSRIRFPAFRIPFQSGYSSYLPCVPVSEAHSGPPSRAAPFFIEKLPRLTRKYYGGSATLGLSTFRPSRFCAYGTLTVCRCPFVPFSGSLPAARQREHFQVIEGNLVFWRRHHKEGVTDVVPITRELGFDNCPVSPCTENLRNVNLPPFDLLPLYRQAVVHLLLSLPGKPLF